MTTIQFLAEWAVRSSVLVLAGLLLLLLVRVRDASVRLAAWVAMLCGSVVLPLLTVAVPAVRTPVVRHVVRPVADTVAVFYDLRGSESSSSQVLGAARPGFDWMRAAMVVYFAIALVLLVRVCIGVAMGWRLLRRSRATDDAGIRESDYVLAPVTLGILRPVVVLPADWREWDEAKLAAVLAHERSHIGRFDPAVQLLSAMHRAVLWFSPASWYLHSSIVRVAEEASDDAALSVTRDRVSYAELLLSFMQRGVCGAGVPMARYGSPEKRIYRILDGGSLSRGVTRWSAAGILMLGLPLAYLAASVRSDELPARAVEAIRAVVPLDIPAAAPEVLAQLSAPVREPARAVAAPVEERRKFDVASIKPCDPNAAPVGGRGRGGGGSAGGPGIFRRNCANVKRIIEDAYIRFADGTNRSPFASVLTKIEGGPAWLDSDQYTIEAEGEEPATIAEMAGPMMQRLLEDRFQLKVHRETRDGVVYGLTATKEALKTLAAKGTPCSAADIEGMGLPFGLPPGDTRPCNLIFNIRKGTNIVLRGRGLSMEQLTQSLTASTGKLVIDKTGMTGNIDLDVLFAPEVGSEFTRPVTPEDAVATADDPAPSIFTALERIGLKLEPGRGSRGYLVIDSVSRPSPN